jgi:hypothetical protein
MMVIKAQKDKSSKGKSQTVKVKPDVAAWEVGSRLPGLEYFFERSNNNKKKRKNSNNKSSFEDNGLTMMLSQSYSQISEHLDGIAKAGEDVIEFTSIIVR